MRSVSPELSIEGPSGYGSPTLGVGPNDAAAFRLRSYIAKTRH